MDAMDLAREALDLTKDVERRVDAHEDICALRYKQLELDLAKDVERRVDAHEDICALRYKQLELDLAKGVEWRVDAHEDICALRYKQLETDIVAVKDEIGDVKKILGWTGTTAFAIIMAVLGFLNK